MNDNDKVVTAEEVIATMYCYLSRHEKNEVHALLGAGTTNLKGILERIKEAGYVHMG